MRAVLRTVVCLALIAASTGVVRANPLDTFGYTSRDIGMGGAATASADSYDACYYNPAALGMLPKTTFGLGLQAYRSFVTTTTFQLDPKTGLRTARETPRADSWGFLEDIGVSSPIPLGEHTHNLFMGLNLVVPSSTLYAIRARPANEPYYPFLEERNRRLVVNTAIAGRYKWIMVGIGMSLLPNVVGNVGLDFGDQKGSNAVSVDVTMSMSANVGILVEPIDGLTVGATWRGANKTYLELPVSLNMSGGTPLKARVLAYDYSTPHELAIGAAYRIKDWIVTGDFTYSFYRDFRQSAPAVTLGSASQTVKTSTWAPDPPFRDSAAVRVGAEWRVHPAVLLRAGLGWVQSPVPAQTELSNLLDGDRWTGSIGLGFDSVGVGGPPITVDVHASYAWMARNHDEKSTFDASNPGFPYVEGGGSVLNTGLTIKLRF